MKREVIRIMAVLVLELSLFSSPAQAKYGGGSGEPDNPYLIYTAEQMNAIGINPLDWGKHFLLCADIDLSQFTGSQFNIIGIDHGEAFTGVFYGNDHKISNFTYDSIDTHHVGLFGFVDGPNAEIKDLGLINPNVYMGRGSCLGPLVGRLFEGKIIGCYVEGGSVSGGSWGVGGLVGNNVGTITNCYTTCNVSGNNTIGGLVGSSMTGTIADCYATGDVSGDLGRIGGLVGYIYSGIIANCYSIGSVSGTMDVGGLVGFNSGSGVVISSYWDMDTSGLTSSANGVGKTTPQMQTASTYINWGCSGAWTIDEGVDYPHLVRENVPGVLITDLPVYAGGSGEPNDPYLIATAEQLNSIGRTYSHLDKHFVLTADIDLSGYTGKEYNIITIFTGVFDGNGHTVSNFTYDSNDRSNVGLFGFVNGPNAEIKNLGLIDPNLDAGTGYVGPPDTGTGNYVGSLVGRLGEGNISGCYVEGGSVLGNEEIGGLVGGNEDGRISNCYVQNCTVMGDSHLGGLVGNNGDGRINNCYVQNGTVVGDHYAGGLAGLVFSGTIMDSYAAGVVDGYYKAGGLVAYVSSGTIVNCYSICSVSGTRYVGGLLATNNGVVISSYWDMDTSGLTRSAAGVGKTTPQMQTASTYSWGCSGVWTIDEGVDYPHLVWENVPGVLINELPVYAGGSGEPNDPYRIATAEQLNTIGRTYCHLDKHFVLTADIDLSGYTGTEYSIITNFAGVFNGNDHTISNFTYDSNDRFQIGLFGYINDPNAEIKNLGLCNPNVDAGKGNEVGPLVGYLRGGIVTNCYVEGGSVSGYSAVGGLVGYVSYGTISGCYATATVTSDKDSYSYCLGGLVGYVRYGTISGCYATGGVTGGEDSHCLGGLCGYNQRSIISNCCASGPVSAGFDSDRLGGLCGYNDRGTISNCCANGSVTGGAHTLYLGGLCGRSWTGGTISDCYSTGSVTGGADSAYLGGRRIIKKRNCTISNCYSTGSVTGKTHVGGLVGHNSRDSKIINSYSIASVSGYSLVGGLVGVNGKWARYQMWLWKGYPGTITNCYSAGSASGVDYVGGLVGNNWCGTIANCYSSGSASGVDYVGGLAGMNYRECTIINCYSTGSVSGTRDVGGLVGYNYSWGGEVTNSVWDIETSGMTTSDRGTGLPTSEMQTMSTFTDAGWDFITPVWTIDESVDYPRLWWEYVPVLHAEARIIPHTINLASKGNWITCYIWLPEQYNVADIDTNSVVLEQHIKSEQLMVDEQRQVAIARFSREEVQSIVDVGEVELTIYAQLTDGTVFEALDVIRVVDEGDGKPDKYVQASVPNPPDGTIDISTTADLSWIAGPYITSHDVYFGTGSQPPFVCNQIDTTFDPGTMDCDTTYYWRIDEINKWGITTGQLWSFTTGPSPGPASNPNPTDGETWVIPDADLSWTAGSYATSHDVYFGTSSTPPFITNQTDTTFEPGRMNPGTTYYWRIDEINKWGKTTGSVWSFTTIEGPPPPPPPPPPIP
jgi:hypothetical protein